MINVNEVYRTVLLILNKEQRGFMTPDEFNNIADITQKEMVNNCLEIYIDYDVYNGTKKGDLGSPF